MAFKFMKKISPEYVIEHAIIDVKTSGMEGLKPYLTEKAEKRVDTIKLVSSGVDLFTGGSMASLLLNKLSDCDWRVIDITKGSESAKGIVGFSFENGEETVTGTVELTLIKEGKEWRIDGVEMPKFDKVTLPLAGDQK
jgi:hypothetical protein